MIRRNSQRRAAERSGAMALGFPRLCGFAGRVTRSRLVIARGDVKLRHLARDPRCALVIFEAVVPFRGVEVRGVATLNDRDVTEVRRSIAQRYLGRDTAEATWRSVRRSRGLASDVGGASSGVGPHGHPPAVGPLAKFLQCERRCDKVSGREHPRTDTAVCRRSRRRWGKADRRIRRTARQSARQPCA